MNIRLITVGKLKEAYLKDAQQEYLKRLGRFGKIEVLELPECKLTDNASAKEEKRSLEVEGEAILTKIKPSDTVIILDIHGNTLSSEQLSSLMSDYALDGKSTLTFVIGGSNGLSKQVKERKDYSLSFSKMTFPHQLFRVMVLEQIYRGFKIANNEIYHK